MTAQHTKATDTDTIKNMEKPLSDSDAMSSAGDLAADSAASRHGAATTARQWQVLSQLQRNRWVGTTHIYEQLKLAGFDISLRTVQRDLNALAKRFPIEKNNANPQGWRWRDDARPAFLLPLWRITGNVGIPVLSQVDGAGSQHWRKGRDRLNFRNIRLQQPPRRPRRRDVERSVIR